ncbi:Segregation and condensation protein A [Caenispirillum salinarum AK4]|uniref:Segregation and condensation protein A n=1 Tax=Caenispirillum salinarum AK4 TaxID=1238182 RepID=K9H2X4_9PROT|nr:ScpA family protein [Caenispirillum salinarum]EKV31409.1 Segregation and condensation protein A [Caenispirillum salinarum AK4]
MADSDSPEDPPVPANDDAPFVDDAEAAADGEAPAAPLLLDLDGFEGPIDVLLNLARDQKVDLVHISILALAEQYLEFIQQARERHLELAADYLVMAAWLAYLKSRLLLPSEETDEEPSGEELAAALQFQLRRLEAMQEAGERFLEMPRLGTKRLTRGAPEDLAGVTRSVYDVTLYDLLRAYADHKKRTSRVDFQIEPLTLYSVDDAIKRIERMFGAIPDWSALDDLLPTGITEPLMRRSAMCAHFIASLELVKQGKLDVRQEGGHYSPIQIRTARDPRPEEI